MTWLLTDEEISAITGPIFDSHHESIALTQLRKVVEEGEQNCHRHAHTEPYVKKHACDYCWLQLKKEAGL